MSELALYEYFVFPTTQLSDAPHGGAVRADYSSAAFVPH